MQLSQEPVRKGETLPRPSQAVLQGRHVVGDLDDVVDRNPRRFFELEEKEIRQRGLRSLDLGGENGFLPNVRVKEEMSVREQRPDTVQAAQREQGPIQAVTDSGIDGERRIRRKRPRDESFRRFRPDGGNRDVLACSPAYHRN